VTAALDEKRYGSVLAKHRPRPIRTEAENERAIALVERLWSETAPEYAALADLLTTLIAKFEEERYALPPASPLDILKELSAANDLTFKEFAAIVGSKGNASEILSGKRRISRALARRLGDLFSVPYALFL